MKSYKNHPKASSWDSYAPRELTVEKTYVSGNLAKSTWGVGIAAYRARGPEDDLDGRVAAGLILSKADAIAFAVEVLTIANELED
jgi:hypothetical protein